MKNALTVLSGGKDLSAVRIVPNRLNKNCNM